MAHDIDSLVISTQARILTRAMDSTLLATAKSRAIDPSVFDTYPPFVWQSEISSDRLDAYYTTMDADTTLVNYARDAAAGVAVLIGHNTRDLPVGSSLSGTLERIGTATRVLSDAYALIEPTTESVINRMKASIVRDVSVGFTGKDAQCLCSICGLDMYRDWSCPHIPGFEYEVTTEGGGRSVGAKTMVLCTGRIVNANLSEYSLVYDGATPGAAVLQAQRQAEAGRIPARQAHLIEQRYRIRLPDKRVQATGADLPTKEQPMDPQEKELAEQRQALNDIRSITERAGAPSDVLLLEQVRWLSAERTRLIPLADDGKAYRDSLLTEALAEGVRAKGEKFSEERYRALLKDAHLDTIRQMRDDWAEEAKARFPAGRITTDEPEPEPHTEPQTPAVPLAVFRS